MASVNLNTLTEVQAAGTGDNLLLFNETSNVATRIDYDKLADAILDKLTTKTYSGISNNVIGAITDLDSRFFKAASGNITSDNINSYTTSGLYLGYIESATITGGGGNSFGLLIVTNPSNTAVRIGQCIVMMPTGYIATRYNMNGTWSAWVPSDKLLKGRQYGSIDAMYQELIAILDVNQTVHCTATGNLVASLTNSEITKVCRVEVVKADTSVLDYMLFAPGSNAIYIGRINSTSSITNMNRFALTSDVATNTAAITALETRVSALESN